MLDNWTKLDLFKAIYNEDFISVAREQGRLSIIDDPELEKSWDQFVQSYNAVKLKYYKWMEVQFEPA